MRQKPRSEDGAPRLTSVIEIMNSLQRVEGGWVEATCPRCGWTFDAHNKNEVYMPVVRHVSGCMEK